MNRKRLTFGLSAFLLVGILGVSLFVLVLFPGTLPTQINLSNFERIKVGMTRQEVEMILGGPPRDETNGNFGGYLVWASTWSWVGSEGQIILDYSKQGDREVVTAKRFNLGGPRRSLRERFRAFLGL